MEARCESCTKGLCIWTRKHEQQNSIDHSCFWWIWHLWNGVHDLPSLLRQRNSGFCPAFESAFIPLGCMLQCRELPWMSRPIVSKLLPFRSSWQKNGQQPDPWQTSSFWALPLTSYRPCHVPMCVVQGRSSKILVRSDMQLFDSEMEPLRPAIRRDLVCPSVYTPKIFKQGSRDSFWIFTMWISHAALWNVILSTQQSNPQVESTPFWLSRALQRMMSRCTVPDRQVQPALDSRKADSWRSSQHNALVMWIDLIPEDSCKKVWLQVSSMSQVR